jgi:hypothetical protein
VTRPVDSLDPATIGGVAVQGESSTADAGALPDEALFDDESLVSRYMRLYYEEWNKPFWQYLRKNVSVDFGYYTGSAQWTDEQKRQMEAVKKPALTLNYIQPVINSLQGAERMNRYDPKAAAEQFEDVKTADVFTRLLRRTVYDANGEFVLSEGFRDGSVCGVVAFELPISYDENPLKPKIECATVRVPDDLIWSTPWRRYDLQDVRAMWRHRWVDVNDLCAHYPKKRKEILDALKEVKAITVADASRVGPILSEGDPKDAYAGVEGIRPEDDQAFWFDIERERVRVLELYYPRFYPTYILASDDGKRVVSSTEEEKIARVYRKLVDKNPFGAFTMLQHNRRKIRMAVLLPVTRMVLEQGQPYARDVTNYPFVPYFANFVRDDVYGVVRSLRDPQDEINSRRSQVAWLLRASGDGWFVEENALSDPAKFQEESRDPKGVYMTRPGKPDPTRIPAPNVPQGLFEIVKMAVNEIAHISGMKTEVTAAGADRQLSGVAMARRQNESDVVSSTMFDTFRLTKRLFYQMMAKRIQEVYTDERTVRLLNAETAQDEFVTINQAVPSQPAEAHDPGSNPSPETRYKVLNDITTLEFDLQMVESPASPTARSAALQTILDLLQKVPALAPLFADEIVQMTDGLPNKDILVKRVKDMTEQLMQPKPPEEPKKNISLKGDVPPEIAAKIAMDAAGVSPGAQDPAKAMGAEAGNEQNPSGQLPTGGAPTVNRPDLPQR